MIIFRPIILAAILTVISGLSAWSQEGLRIFISADMEGLVGSVSGQQVSRDGLEYATYREIMTKEVIAAIEGARAAGATEFVVADSHGNMQNLMIELLPKDVQVVRGRHRSLGMVEGIYDGHFDGAIFIGYHASEATEMGVMAHTISGGTFGVIQINGMDVTEGYMNAAVLGEFGVPLIMITGDDGAVNEVSSTVGDMEKAIVKKAYGSVAAKTLTPAAAYDLIRERAEVAVGRIDDFEPFVLEGPITLDLTFKRGRRAELLEWLPDPNLERTGKNSIRYTAPDMTTMTKFIMFVIDYPGS